MILRGFTSLITDAASEPLTTAEAKLHLRVDGSTEDTYIDNLIKAARIYCEKYTNRSFIGIEQDDKYFEIAEKRIKGN